MTQYIFHGNGTAPAAPAEGAYNQPEPYVADQSLIEAVNLAILLRRPLLLEGEAGCGKSRLARAVAYELGLPFAEPWCVRSTSKAQEGLYTYDALLRMYDVHAAAHLDPQDTPHQHDAPRRNPYNPKDYRRLAQLGQAFARHDCPTVVLIDEIDKADLDFPNDLLTVLDKPWHFHISETGEDIQANPDHLPIVIITSNREKGHLPDPFLRRCIYHFVAFPQEQDLKKIIDAHNRHQQPDDVPLPETSSALYKDAVQRFVALRTGDKRMNRPPGLSEFLDWLKALHNAPPTSKPLSRTDSGDLPFAGLLVKRRDDWNNQVGRKQ